MSIERFRTRPAIAKADAAYVSPTGDRGAAIAFVGASPAPVDVAMGMPLSGAAGETFIETYLDPLRLTFDDVFLTNAVGVKLAHDDGRVRSPTPAEIEAWRPWLLEQLDAVNPHMTVALGRVAKMALGDKADAYLPHPSVLSKRHDSGEVARKTRTLRRRLALRIKREDREVGRAKISKSDAPRQIVYGVVLEPGTFDAQNDTMTVDEIEKTAHAYLVRSRVVGDSHSRRAPANVVESFIAPVDFELDAEKVLKGSWVMGVKVADQKLWGGVENGDYTGFSVGGFGVRELI